MIHKRTHAILLLIIAILCTTKAQKIEYINLETEQIKGKQQYLLLMDLAYEHTLSHQSNIYTQMLVDLKPAKWVEIYGGFHVSTSDLYQLTARGDFKWWLSESRNLALRNQYTYGAYASDNLQNLCMALALCYNQEYFTIAIGGYTQFFTNFLIKEQQERTYIWEPGITYDITGCIFKREHIWNLGLQVTNMRDFTIERPYAPNFILNGNYRILGKGNDHLNIYGKLGIQPSGIFSIAANYYSLYFQFGISCAL